MVREEPTRSGDAVPRPRQTTKKQQIMALYLSGIADIEDLATITNTRASYVGKVLQDSLVVVSNELMWNSLNRTNSARCRARL